MCWEFPINPFALPRHPNSTSHRVPVSPSHVMRVVRLHQREANARSRWLGLLRFPSTALTPCFA